MTATVNNQAKQTTAKNNAAKQSGATAGNLVKISTAKNNQGKQSNATISGQSRYILLVTEDNRELLTEDGLYFYVPMDTNNQSKN